MGLVLNFGIFDMLIIFYIFAQNRGALTSECFGTMTWYHSFFDLNICGTKWCSQISCISSCICQLFRPWIVDRIGFALLLISKSLFHWKVWGGPGSWGRFASGLANFLARFWSYVWNDYEYWNRSELLCPDFLSQNERIQSFKARFEARSFQDHCSTEERCYSLLNFLL